MRSNYWTCSAFADWLRGTPKPGAATSEGWAEWTKTAKTAHPFRYWLADDALDYLQKAWCFIPDKINDVRYYLTNRFVHRTHCMNSRLEPGKWHEFETKLLHSAFDELVDFVEVEQAWHHVMWADEEVRAQYKLPWWRRQWWTRWGQVWRCPQAGLDHLDWASKLRNDEFAKPGDEDYGKPTQQAIAAMEILDLYNWWTQVYKNRPDPMDASGWSAVCEKNRELNGGEWSMHTHPSLKKETERALKLSHKIEEEYYKEDEKMLIRLIKIRKSIWT